MGKKDHDDLKRFLAEFPEESQRTALALRDFVWDLFPACNELIYDNYNFLAFGWSPNDKTGDAFCSIAVGMKGVGLVFIRGVEIADPEKLLTGTGNQVRSFHVEDMAAFPSEYMRGLLVRAFENSVELLKGRPQMPHGKTIVKSISEKMRRPGMKRDEPKLRRDKLAMPDFISEALSSASLTDSYDSRPPYQRNDYISWITGAKREETRNSRLAQMLNELQRGDIYMKMPYKPKRP